MGILRRIENGLEGVFEGGIGRTFKSHVQPVELARKLAKEMDDHRTISVSQVYVPNVYTVYLAPADREQFATYEASLRTELAAYLTEHARREGYALPSRVRVMIESAEELPIGSFGIAVDMQEGPPPRPVTSGTRNGRARRTPPPPRDEAGLPAEFMVEDELAPPPLPVRPAVAPEAALAALDPFAGEAAPAEDPAGPLGHPAVDEPSEPSAEVDAAVVEPDAVDAEPESDAAEPDAEALDAVEAPAEAAVEPAAELEELDDAVAEPEPEPEVEPAPEAGPAIDHEAGTARDLPAVEAALAAAPAPPAPPPPVVPEPRPEPPVVPVPAPETVVLSQREAGASDLVREEWALTWPGGRFVIDRRALVLGRSRDCDVVLADTNVSRRHAELIRQGQGYLLRDLDSTNGSLVNGRRVREAPVTAGDTLTLGTTSLRLERKRTDMVEQVLVVLRIAFVLLLYLVVWRIVSLSVRDVRARPGDSMILAPGVAAAPAPMAARPAATARPAGPGRLVVTKSPAYPAGTVVLCDDTVVFGRGPESDAVLDGDEFASTRHARSFRRGQDVYVEDLGSTNGTFVNGQRLTAERKLRDGDVLRVGGSELVFRTGSA